MATYTDLMSLFNDIGSAINDKGVNGQHYPYQMASAIRSISTGISVSGTYSVSSYGTFNITSYESVYVPRGNAGATAVFESSTATISPFRQTTQAGWINVGTGMGNTVYLPSTSISTITPSSTSQVAVSQYTWTLNDVVVEAIPSSYIIPEGTSTITANGTYDITSFASVSVAIPVGDFINNQENIVVTPTEEEQIVSAAAGYTGLGPVTINGISSTYVGTGVPVGSMSKSSTSTAYRIFVNSGYFSQNIQQVIDAESITTPSITINNATGLITGIASASRSTYYSAHSKTGTLQLTTQAGTTVNPSTASQTIVPAFRWTTGSIIVNAMPAPATLPAINGSAFLATTGDYDFGVTVTIPEGYYSETTVSQNFASVYPALGSQASASHILAGKEAYDGLGHIVSGGMTNNGKVTATLTSTTTTYTIPAGYHDGTGTVSHTTVAIPVPTFSMSSTTGTITASGNWTRGFTTNSTYTSTYTLTTRAGATITPTETQQTAVSAYRWTTGSVLVAAISSTYVGTGIATISSANVTVAGQSVTAPAGYYSSAITKAVTTMTLPTTFPTTSTGTVVATIGRSTATKYLNIPVGYNTTSRFYTISSVPNGTVTAPTNISSTSATLTAGTNTITLAKTISVTPNVTTAGYISSGTAGNANVTLTAAVATKAASTITPTTANQTAVAANTYVTGAITVAAIPSSYKLLSQTTTATSSTMLESVTAYNSNGELITGNVHVISYFTGTSAPTSSLGRDGDIYLQTDGR